MAQQRKDKVFEKLCAELGPHEATAAQELRSALESGDSVQHDVAVRLMESAVAPKVHRAMKLDPDNDYSQVMRPPVPFSQAQSTALLRVCVCVCV